MVNSHFQQKKDIFKFILTTNTCLSKSLILFIFLSLFVTKQNFVEAKTSLSPWRLTYSDRHSQTWKLKNRRDVIGALQTNTRKKTIDWTKIKTKDFFLNLKRSKKQILSKIGISDWTVTKSTWKKKSNHHELTMEGSYKDIKNQTIYFHEVHLFYKRRTKQILVSYLYKKTYKESDCSSIYSKC